MRGAQETDHDSWMMLLMVSRFSLCFNQGCWCPSSMGCMRCMAPPFDPYCDFELDQYVSYVQGHACGYVQLRGWTPSLSCSFQGGFAWLPRLGRTGISTGYSLSQHQGVWVEHHRMEYYILLMLRLCGHNNEMTDLLWPHDDFCQPTTFYFLKQLYSKWRYQLRILQVC